jgi:hypothetical protein
VTKCFPAPLAHGHVNIEFGYMHFTSYGRLDRESDRASVFSALKLTD